jgi:hypothetical protein
VPPICVSGECVSVTGRGTQQKLHHVGHKQSQPCSALPGCVLCILLFDSHMALWVVCDARCTCP